MHPCAIRKCRGGVWRRGTDDSKKEALRLFCLSRNRGAQDCIRRRVACALGRPCDRARSTGEKTGSIFLAESLSLSLVRFSSDRYYVKDPGVPRAASRAYRQRSPRRCQTPCPAPHSPFFALHQEASEALP